MKTFEFKELQNIAVDHRQIKNGWVPPSELILNVSQTVKIEGHKLELEAWLTNDTSKEAKIYVWSYFHSEHGETRSSPFSINIEEDKNIKINQGYKDSLNFMHSILSRHAPAPVLTIIPEKSTVHFKSDLSLLNYDYEGSPEVNIAWAFNYYSSKNVPSGKLKIKLPPHSLSMLEDYGKFGDTFIGTELRKMEDMIIKASSKGGIEETDKSYEAVDIAEKIGFKALPTLIRLLEKTKNESRHLNYHCLSMIKDESVLKIMANALNEEDEEVRIIALHYISPRFDHSKYDPTIFNELIESLKSRYPEVRGASALWLGFTSDKRALEHIEKALKKESNDETKKKMKLVCAKLGNKKMQDEIISGININDPSIRLKVLEDLRYIKSKRLAKGILPALADKGPGHAINKNKYQFARICDTAINVISFLFDNPFDFEVKRSKIYSDEEIEKARKFLKSL